MMPRWFKALAWLTVANFAVLTWLGATDLAPSDAFKMFDAHFAPYDLDYARAYLTALSPEAKQLYLGPVRMLDTLFPALLTAALLILFRVKLSGIWRAALMVLTLAYLGADYAENAQVAGLIRMPVDALTVEGVARAGLLTMTKWITLLPCLGAAAWIWLRGRIAASETAQ